MVETKEGNRRVAIMLRLPPEMDAEVRARAKAAYRSIGGELTMLIERGLAAEKTASEHTA